MAYNKHTLIDYQTVITADLLGEMDNGIYQNDLKIAAQEETINNKANKSDLDSYATIAYVDQSIANSIDNIQLDTTLTEEGMAADAKAVGTALQGKVSKTDIADNVVTNNATKVLSAAQGFLLAGRITVLENNANNGGSGSGSTARNWLDRDSTGTAFNDAVRDYQYNRTPIMFVDDVDICPMITFTNSELAAPICYFLNGRTKQILEVLNGGAKVRVYITDLKYTVRAVFTEEDMDNILSNAKDDNEGEVYQYLGTQGKYSNGSIYSVTKEQEEANV